MTSSPYRTEGPVRYASVCSGIEAATAAWHPLGWQPAFFSEIEPFPCAVLAHHYPHVPNLGDMTRFQEWPDADIDVLVGGTPCQSFSVAGLRKGLDDPRGNLMLTFGAIARRYRPRWLVWENVPGVLSSNGGRDFGTFLGLLGELGYGFAYRVLDAQYIRVDSHPRAVPQRRRRVFVVGHLGDWRRAAAVLFERESMSGHPAPRREAGKAAPTIPSRSTAGGGLGTDFDCDGGLVESAGLGLPFLQGGQSSDVVADLRMVRTRDANAVASDVAGSLCADTHPGAYSGQDAYTGRLVATARETGQGFWTDDGTAGLRANPGGMPENLVAHALRAEGFDASEDGTGRGTPIVPIAFSCKDHGADAGEIAPTLRSMSHDGSHANGGGQVAIAMPAAWGMTELEQLTRCRAMVDAREPQAVAFSHGAAAGARSVGYSVEHSPTIRGGAGGNTMPAIMTQMAVRRLTPRECERLQGFPDDYTDIVRTRGTRNLPAADGPRYKALGNSMAIPPMSWIGQGIDLVDAIPVAETAAA